MKKLAKDDLNLKEWEFEFQQRNSHPILMADLWCRAVFHKFVGEINLPVEKYDYLFTSFNKGYVKTEHKTKALEEIKKAFEKDDEYLNYVYNQTIKRVNSFDVFTKRIIGECKKVNNKKDLARLWKEFDEEFTTLIPWYWIPYYVVEQNLLSDKVKEKLIEYKYEIEKITDFNNAFIILISPDKELMFQEEQKDFYKLVETAKNDKEFSNKEDFIKMAEKYLEKYSWMKTFILLPLEPLSLEELIEKINKALGDNSIEEHYLKEKQKLKNKDISEEIFNIIKDDKELVSSIEECKKFGWVLSWSVETSLKSLATLIPFFKLKAKNLNVPYSQWVHLTSQEIIRALEEDLQINPDELTDRYKGFVYLMENGTIKTAVGEEGKEIAQWIDDNVGTADLNVTELKGHSASPGIVKSKVKIALTPKDSYLLEKGEILVTSMTSPDYVPAMKRASAIITDEGGMLSHAAIMSREFGKPCVIGTKNATRLLKDGDYVEVDANKGTVKIIKRKS